MAIKKVLISAGGTGGHLYPAQGLAQEMKKRDPSCELLFVAGGLKTSRHFDREQFSFREIACAPLISKNPLKVFKGLKNLLKGTRESIAILKEFKPDVVVGFGSFYTVPVMLAAKYLKIPSILHEANSVPGKANYWLASLADAVALHFPSTAAYFKGNTHIVGLPLRDGYRLGAVTREKALSYFQLTHERPTLLIFGGSQGAQGINRALQDCFPHLQKLGLQVIHVTGDQKTADQLSLLYASHDISAAVKPYEKEMQMAWSAADLFIGRSGASTVAESVAFEVPGILVPYPSATDNHQEKNADFLVETVGSAWKILESELIPGKLGSTLELFFQREQMDSFRKALKTYKQRPHQMTLCDLVEQMMERKGT